MSCPQITSILVKFLADEKLFTQRSCVKRGEIADRKKEREKIARLDRLEEEQDVHLLL
jgi:hypothetical protein